MISKIAGARRGLPLVALLGLTFTGAAFAQGADEGSTPADLKVMLDAVWVLVTAFLVFGLVREIRG